MDAIRILYYYRDKIPKWKQVVERFMKDNYKFAQFYFENSKNKDCPMRFIPAITECELERLGHAIGDVFAPASDDFWMLPMATTMYPVFKTVHKLRQDNPELAKKEQWKFFEDLFYMECYFHMCNEDDRNSLFQESFEEYLEILYFAEKNKYKVLQPIVAVHIVTAIFKNEVWGFTNWEQCLEHLPYLIQRLWYLPSPYFLNRRLVEASPDNFLGTYKLYEVLSDETIGKRRLDYVSFLKTLYYKR